MIQGPNAGPAMVLNILMRWPPLIVVAALAGVAAIGYDKVEADQYIESVKKLAVDYGIMKANVVVQAAKKVEVIPAANAAGMAHDGRTLSPIVETAAVAPTPEITVDQNLTPEELLKLRHIQLQGLQVTPVRVGATQ